MKLVQRGGDVWLSLAEHVWITRRIGQPALEEAGGDGQVDAQTQVDHQARFARARLVAAEQGAWQRGQGMVDGEHVANAEVVQDAHQVHPAAAFHDLVDHASDEQTMIGHGEVVRAIVYWPAAHVPLQARQAARQMRSVGGGCHQRGRIHLDVALHGAEQRIGGEACGRFVDAGL